MTASERTEQVLAVIPARYASTRFPGKPLVLIDGQPMIQHVWQRVRQARGVEQVVIATDDTRIRDAAEAFGATVCMTDPAHRSGTDRVWEVAQQWPDYGVVVNVQGDEPGLDPAHLTQAIDRLTASPEADIVTLVTPITTPDDIENPNCVKAVMAMSGQVLYFSRATVPALRDSEQAQPQRMRHLGLYVFRRAALARFAALPPSPLEQAEQLEQLRALEHGMRIDAVCVDRAPVGIDTPDDLARLRQA